MQKIFRVLGIESSCDESAASVVTSDKQILSNIVMSQFKDHMPYQGIVPEIAARKHLTNVELCISQALSQSSLTLEDIDAISVTSGPGLIGSLIVGVMYAKALAHVAKKPLININHLEGHILTSRLTNDLEYPFLVLLLSGGHTQFVLVKDFDDYKVIGQTIDDAAGECFDKAAKMMGLGYPGGPMIEKLAREGDKTKYSLPLPMSTIDSSDMSFSGLKTAVKNLIYEIASSSSSSKLNSSNSNSSKLNNPELTFEEKCDISASLQHCIAKILSIKTKKALQIARQIHARQIHNPQINTLVLAGGVAANQYIKNYISEFLSPDCKIISPPIDLCTDNAAMIAWAGIERIKKFPYILNQEVLTDNKQLNPNLKL